MEMHRAPQQSQAPRTTQLAQQFAARIGWIVMRSEYYILEVVMGVGAAGWGLWLLNPAWNSFGSTPTFHTMSRIASEEVWGLIILLFGLLQILAAGLQAMSLRRVLALLGIWLWMTISIMFAHANIGSTGVVIYALLEALPNTLISFRLAIEAGRRA